MRAHWTSASFLLYAGGVAIAFALLGLLGVLGADYGKAAFVGWALLVFAVVAAYAEGLRRVGRPVAAGLFAVNAVIAFVVFVGALENWFGWVSNNGGFHLGNFLLEVVAVVASFMALRRFRFPLLVLVGTVSSWFFLTDLLSNGGNWSAVVTLVFGLVLVIIGVSVDRAYGFWVHVVAGVTIGGAFLYFWHTSELDWILVAIASLVYILVANALSRSSYAVLGAFGLFLAATYFIVKWFVVSFPLPFGLFGGSQAGGRFWAAALGYAVYGLALMALGLALERRRRNAVVSPSA